MHSSLSLCVCVCVSLSLTEVSLCLAAVRSCQPPLAGLPALVEGLNANDDFSAFVWAVRAAFKAEVAAA